MSLQRFNFAFSEDEDSAGLECWGVVLPDGGVAYKLKELVVFLEYKDVKKSYKLIPEEWKITWKNWQNKLEPLKAHLMTSSDLLSNWHPETLFLTEPGVYALMAESNKPMAKEKVRFVYETILPTIRKTGRFDSAAVLKINNGRCISGRRCDRSAAHPREVVPWHSGPLPQLTQHHACLSRASRLLYASGDDERPGLDGQGGLRPALTPRRPPSTPGTHIRLIRLHILFTAVNFDDSMMAYLHCPDGC